MGHELGTGIRVRGLPEQIEQRHGAVWKGASQTEGMLDELCSVEPGVLVRAIPEAQHLAKVSLIAPRVPDLLLVGGREFGPVGRQVFGQLGLDPDHAAGARKHDVEVGCTAAAESGGAFPFETKIVRSEEHTSE